MRADYCASQSGYCRAWLNEAADETVAATLDLAVSLWNLPRYRASVPSNFLNGIEEVVSSNLTRSTKHIPSTPRQLRPRVAISALPIIPTRNPKTVQEFAFHRRTRGMDRTAFPPA